MALDEQNAVLLIGGSSEELYMIDLEGGQNLQPATSSCVASINELATSPSMPLLAAGGSRSSSSSRTNGWSGAAVELWDMRSMDKSINALKVKSPGAEAVTSVAWSNSGMNLAVGLDTGRVLVYDVRSKKPMAERDHRNNLPIKGLEYVQTTNNATTIASADTKAVKIWDYGSCNGTASSTTGQKSSSSLPPSSSPESNNTTDNDEQTQLLLTLESDTAINDIAFFPNSGLLFAARDDERVGTYFLPSLGVAPPWCSFLDNMTEELAESAKSMLFDDYRFISLETVRELGAEDLLNTRYLQPYLHGYFIDEKLFTKLKKASAPFEYEQYLDEKREKELSAKVPMRVPDKEKLKTAAGTKGSASKKGVKANSQLFEKLQDQLRAKTSELSSARSKAAGEKAGDVLADDRFSRMFENPDFEIDAEELGKKFASGVNAKRRKKG